MTAEVTELPGGLTVVTDAMETVESLSLGVWVDVGTRHEPEERNGVAHVLEHMAFKGTERRSAYDISQEIEAVGGHLNAYTSRECTAYYAKVLAPDRDLALDIISDILQYPVFDPEELRREQAVILQEIGQALDTPDDVIFDLFQEAIYPDQALGRPVLGSAEVVASLGQGDLRDYMGASYGPKRMVVAAAGKVRHGEFTALVAEKFAALPDVPAGEVQPARYAGGEVRQPRDLEQVHVLLGFDSISLHDPDYYAVNLLSTLFGGGMSSRLFQEVREKRGLVYSVYSFNSSYVDGGTFGVYAGTGPEQVRELVPVICDEFCKLTAGVSEEEVERAKAQMRASLLMGREGSSARCEQAAQQMMTYGRPLGTEEILTRLEAIDCADVERLAGKLIASAPTLAALGPIDAVEPLDKVIGRLQ